MKYKGSSSSGVCGAASPVVQLVAYTVVLVVIQLRWCRLAGGAVILINMFLVPV